MLITGALSLKLSQVHLFCQSPLCQQSPLKLITIVDIPKIYIFIEIYQNTYLHTH